MQPKKEPPTKKAGRPKCYTADYFPLYVAPTPELEYLENMYKANGFVSFTNCWWM